MSCLEDSGDVKAILGVPYLSSDLKATGDEHVLLHSRYMKSSSALPPPSHDLAQNACTRCCSAGSASLLVIRCGFNWLKTRHPVPLALTLAHPCQKLVRSNTLPHSEPYHRVVDRLSASKTIRRQIEETNIVQLSSKNRSSEWRARVDKPPVDMSDEAQDEHVVEQEKTCNDRGSEDDNASCLVVEADGHNIEYAFLSQVRSIISN